MFILLNAYKWLTAITVGYTPKKCSMVPLWSGMASELLTQAAPWAASPRILIPLRLPSLRSATGPVSLSWICLAPVQFMVQQVISFSTWHVLGNKDDMLTVLKGDPIAKLLCRLDRSSPTSMRWRLRSFSSLISPNSRVSTQYSGSPPYLQIL